MPGKDFSEQRQQVAAHGKSIFRIFNAKYRAALADIKGVLKAELPNAYADRLGFIDGLIVGQQSLKKLRGIDATGHAAFGTQWKREKSDWAQFTVIIDWVAQQIQIGLGSSFRSMFAGINDPATTAKLVEQLSGRLALARGSTQNLFTELSVDSKASFGTEEFNEIKLETVTNRLKACNQSIHLLPLWTTYALRAQHARAEGMGSLVEALENGTIPTKDLSDAFDRIYFSQLLRSLVRQKPELAHFDGELHERHVADFRELDNERLALAKYRALMAHFNGLPPHSAVGAAGIVRSEMERKRGHRSVRRFVNGG